MSITYSEGEFVALVIQHAMLMEHIAICGLFGPAIFFQIILKAAQRERNSLNIKFVSWFPPQIFLNISHPKKKWARCDHKYLL